MKFIRRAWNNRPRARHVLIFGGSLLFVLSRFATDPDGGFIRSFPVFGSTLAEISNLSWFVLALAAAHVGRRGLFDYIDLQRVFRKAMEHPIGAGAIFLAVALVMHGVLGLFQVARAQVPDRAHQYLPVLAAEIDRNWPGIPMRSYPAGLIEHESCLSLTHSRCWSPTSQLKTAREEGAGLGQLTRAYTAGGALRFDALDELRDQHGSLRELTWANVYTRADLQMRAVVLKLRGDFITLSGVPDPMQRLAMTDAAYNGGIGGLLKERRACGLRADCDAGQWWGNVENNCLKSRAVLYGIRSACDINRQHVVDVLRARAPKYAGLL